MRECLSRKLIRFLTHQSLLGRYPRRNTRLLLFAYLTSQSPVCSYLQPSKQCLEIAGQFCKIDIRNEDELEIIKKDIPVFFALLNVFPENEGIPKDFEKIFTQLIDISMLPFSVDHKVHPAAPSDSNMSR